MEVVVDPGVDIPSPVVLPAVVAHQHFQRRRPPYKRTTTGCLTCRLRRKKCDETKPECIGCARNFLTCTWPAAQPPQQQLQQQQQQRSELNVVPKPLAGQWTVSTEKQAHTAVAKLSEKKERKKDEKNKQKLLTRSRTTPSHVYHGVSQPTACFLTPLSSDLIQHYVSETGALLAAVPANQNAFISYVLPLAYSDSLLMNTVLCLSAAHLTCYQRDNNQNVDLERTTLTHYAVVIRGLRDEVRDLQIQENPEKALRLLLTLIVVCHVEAVSGNTSGTIFHHLRACRQLILSLLDSKPKLGRDDQDLLGFILELYAYMVLVNSIIPYGLLAPRTVPYDFLVLSLDYLREYRTFGIMFAGGHGLFELISHVSLLAQRRLEEEVAGISLDSSACHTSQRRLHAQIENWQPPPPSIDDDDNSNISDEIRQRLITAEIFRNALHIYLATAMCGSVVSDTSVRAAIQTRITTTASLVLLAFDAVHATTLLWPALVGGSCMIDPDQQDFLENQLGVNRFRMRHTVQASKLLRVLWNEAKRTTDARMYGPYGLYLVMEKFGLDTFCTL